MRDHRGVRTGVLLRDRVRVAPLAPARREEVPLLLVLGGVREWDRRPPRDVPEPAGGRAPLLLDQDLLEEVEALTAVVLRVVDRVEAGVEHRPLRVRGALRAEPVVLLALELEGDQHAFGEAPGAIPELEILGREADVHRPGEPSGRACAGAGPLTVRAGRSCRGSRGSRVRGRRPSIRPPAGSRRGGRRPPRARPTPRPMVLRPAPIGHRRTGRRPHVWSPAPSTDASPPPRCRDRRSRDVDELGIGAGDRGLGPRLAVEAVGSACPPPTPRRWRTPRSRAASRGSRSGSCSTPRRRTAGSAAGSGGSRPPTGRWVRPLRRRRALTCRRRSRARSRPRPTAIPSQCRTSARSSDAAGSPTDPTAHTSAGEIAATPFSTPSISGGSSTWDHSVPS